MKRKTTRESAVQGLRVLSFEIRPWSFRNLLVVGHPTRRVRIGKPLRVASIAFALLAASLGLGATRASTAPATIAGIHAYARPFLAKARAGRPSAIFANFAGDGIKYVRYPSEHAFARALRAFLDGPAPGGGSFVARIYRVAGSRGCYVTFDPGVANSLTEHERVVFDGRGRAIWIHQEVDSFNGYYRTVRDAYFAGGVPIADRTIRYEYAPNDTAFVHPLKRSKTKLEEMTIPVYETRAKLPFPA
jgi:hypothetical protein